MEFEDIVILGLIGGVLYLVFTKPESHYAIPYSVAPQESPRRQLTDQELAQIRAAYANRRVSPDNAAWWTAAGIPGIYAGMLMSDAQPILNANADKITAYMIAQQGPIPLP